MPVSCLSGAHDWCGSTGFDTPGSSVDLRVADVVGPAHPILGCSNVAYTGLPSYCGCRWRPALLNLGDDDEQMDLVDMSEREYWAFVAKRPGMFVGRSTLTGLEAFLEGYDQHSMRHGGPGLSGWLDWLVARRSQHCNHAWPGQVRHLALPDGWDGEGLSADQEQHVIRVLFELLDQFLAEREAKAATR